MFTWILVCWLAAFGGIALGFICFLERWSPLATSLSRAIGFWGGFVYIRCMTVSYGVPDFLNADEIYRVAEIHEAAPLNWDSSWKVTDDGVRNWVRFLEKSKTDPSVLILVAKSSDGAIVGSHWVKLTEKHGVSCGHIQSLWVDERLRGRGIGHELKKRGEDWARQAGAKFLTTDVFYSNQKMIDYNLKQGFKPQQVEMTKNL